jgi:beta-lactamase regulating signal transducer with metallopeptidase domain
VTYFLRWAIEASVIVGAALAAAFVLRQRSAAVRHWILAAAILCAAIAPLGSQFLPSLEWIPAIQASLPGPDPTSSVETAAGGFPTGGSQRGSNAAMTPWLVSLWLAGVIAGLTVLIVGWARLTRVALKSEQAPDGLWTKTAASIALQSRLRRRVCLLQTRNPSILATWGVLRPAVLLPAGSENWPGDRIYAVLCHELAHVRRLDWLFQTLAELLRAIFWFNPLFWIMCRRLRMESEFACDDAVLVRGVSGSRYASHLLDVVRTLQTDRAWSAALSLTRPSTLERRFSAMVDSSLDRRPLNVLVVVAIAIAALSLTLPLSALSRAAAVQKSPNVAATVSAPAVPSAAAVVSPAPAARAVAPQQPQPVVGPAPVQYKGEPIDLDLTNVDLAVFFRLIGNFAGLNIVLDPNVSGQTTVQLRSVPWDQALDIVLSNAHLTGNLQGNVLSISAAPAAQDRIALDFEVYRNGALLGKPRIATGNGSTGTLSQSDAQGKEAFHISVTPRRSTDGSINIDLEFGVDNSSSSFKFLLSQQAPAKLTWKSGSDSFELRVTLAPPAGVAK